MVTRTRFNVSLHYIVCLFKSINDLLTVTWTVLSFRSALEMQTCCSAICGNKMPTRCTRGFYCRSYYMFRAPLCPSSGAQEYYTVVAACGVSCCGFQFVGLMWSWGLCVRFAGCCSILQTGHIFYEPKEDKIVKYTPFVKRKKKTEIVEQVSKNSVSIFVD